MRATLIALALLGGAAIPPGRAADLQSSTEIERGRYLVTVGDCAACHTDAGGRPFAGGRAVETPFGAVLAPNLTPDPQTGIGNWTDAEFYRAMHEGVGRGGEHLYPAFPYTAFTKVSRDDVRAIRAWLATLEPVRNPVRANQLPFPFSVRASLAAWDALYFRPGEYVPDPSRSEQWNRGAYLVQGLGHCGTCHTPKTTLGGDEPEHYVQGEPLQGWYAPNLTGDASAGLGNWSVEDVVAYLRDGANAHQTSSGPMAEVVSISTSHMTEADLRAVAVYLKSLPPAGRAAGEPVGPHDARYLRGQAIYVDGCSACHGPTGAGVPGLFPQLAGSAAVQQRGPQALIGVVLRGARAVATDRAVTAPAMPGFGWKLDDGQVADVLTYVRNAWGNEAPAVDADRVASQRTRLAGE